MASKWLATLKAIAPTIASAWGGPLVGTAVQLVGEALLGDKNSSKEDLEKIIDAGLSTDQIAKIKQIEYQFKIDMRELDIKIDEIEVLDRASARDREKIIGRIATLGIHSLGALIIFGFFVTVHWVLTTDNLTNDPIKLALIGAMVGYVSAKADQVVAYFFGSSVGSKEKTRNLSDALTHTIDTLHGTRQNGDKKTPGD